VQQCPWFVHILSHYLSEHIYTKPTSLKWSHFCERNKIVTIAPTSFELLYVDTIIIYFFDIHVTVHCVKFLIIKPTRCTNFSNLFLEWNSACFGQFLCPSSGLQWKTPDDEQRDCPKHVEFYSKNKFEKLVHLVGFNIRNIIYLFPTSVIIFFTHGAVPWRLFINIFAFMYINKNIPVLYVIKH